MMQFWKTLFYRLALFCIGLFAVQSAQAALHLELTQGINSAIPIEILPFANATNNVSGNTTLTAVIKNDLQNSGEFRVKTPGVLDNYPTQLSQINSAHWRSQGVNDIVIGNMSKSVLGSYKVSFRLIDLYARSGINKKVKNSAALPSDAVLLNESFKVKKAGLRQLAHHISDLIYQKLTGVRGIFSTKIAYILVQQFDNKPTQYLLEVADADGFHPQTLLRSTQPIMSPTWTPNGLGIAYVSFEGHRSAIFLQDLATGHRKLISRFPGINGAPAFSSDGQKMAFVLSTTGNPKIFVLNLRTRKLAQITHGYSIDTEPVWLADGKSIIFTSSRGGGPQIYQYHFANRQVSRLTFDGSYNARACLTADNKTMVMMHRQNGLFGIAKENLSSGRVTVLTESGTDESPSLAPNGKMVLYGTRFAGRAVLGVVSLDGRIKLRLPAQEGNVQDPAWSPFIVSR